MTAVVRMDGRLVGATAIVHVSAALTAVACTVTRHIVTLNRQYGDRVVSCSADLGGEPGCLILSNSALWTVTSAGAVVKLTTAATPIVSVTTAVGAATNRWVTSYGTVIIAPGRPGGIVTLSTSNVVLARAEGVLDRVEWAIADSSGHLYAFDGAGNGVVLTVNGTTGAIAALSLFTAADCHGALNGYITGTTLVIACEGRDTVATFDISDATAVVRDDRTAYDSSGYTVNGVYAGDPAATPLTNEPAGLITVPQWYPATAGLYTDTVESTIAQGRSGRMDWAGTLQVTPPDAVPNNVFLPGYQDLIGGMLMPYRAATPLYGLVGYYRSPGGVTRTFDCTHLCYCKNEDGTIRGPWGAGSGTVNMGDKAGIWSIYSASITYVITAGQHTETWGLTKDGVLTNYTLTTMGLTMVVLATTFPGPHAGATQVAFSVAGTIASSVHAAVTIQTTSAIAAPDADFGAYTASVTGTSGVALGTIRRDSLGSATYYMLPSSNVYSVRFACGGVYNPNAGTFDESVSPMQVQQLLSLTRG